MVEYFLIITIRIYNVYQSIATGMIYIVSSVAMYGKMEWDKRNIHSSL